MQFHDELFVKFVARLIAHYAPKGAAAAIHAFALRSIRSVA